MSVGGRVVLVDSNVILDIRSEDPVWFEWSSQALATAAEAYELAINPSLWKAGGTLVNVLIVLYLASALRRRLATRSH